MRSSSIVASTTVLALVGHAFAGGPIGGLILNEYNAVGSQKWLGNSNDVACEGPAGFDCSDEEDTFFGRVQGNGGNWIELVVTVDNLDVRGWELRIAEISNDETDGTDLWFGNPFVEQGIIRFTNDPFWSNLRAGTVLTITELTTAQGGLDTDLSFDPCAGDWWINVNSFDTALLDVVNNVLGDGPGNFSVGNDEFLLEVHSGSGPGATLLFGPAGEGAPKYGGGGVNSREVCRLEENPSSSITGASFYDDANGSSFGRPNYWGSNFPGLDDGCRYLQEFIALRDSIVLAECPCPPVILNEYNAVSNATFLNGGDEFGDDDGDLAADSFFGRIAGNGGNWFELVVVTDGLDMRGWRLDWEEVVDEESGSIFLTNDPFWSSVPAGRIITFIQRGTEDGGLDTNLSAGPNWSNVNTYDTSLVSMTTSTKPDDESGDFTTSNDGWRLSIRDAQGNLVAGPAGEGFDQYYGRGIGSTEVGQLQADPSRAITPASIYNEQARTSTFGAPNVWVRCENFTVVTYVQDFSALPDRACVAKSRPGNPADLNGDGVVDGADLGLLLNNWGNSGLGDINGDGAVDGADLGLLLNNWGA